MEQQIDISEYDLTQDDEVDESYSKGIWDLAYLMLVELKEYCDNDIVNDDTQTFIYHFLRDFKKEVESQKDKKKISIDEIYGFGE